MDFVMDNPASSKNSLGQSPLYLAIKFGDVYMAQTLLQKGAEVNVMDAFGNTPLSLACIEKPNVNMIKLLLRYGANVNFERVGHLDLLLECILNGDSKIHIKVISFLIEHGIYINATDRISNRNCMHYVAITGYLPLADLLLKNGAYLDIRDNFNFTPKTLAEIYNNKNVLDLFNRCY